MKPFLLVSFVAFLLCCIQANGWGFDGHFTICRIAQSHLTKVADKAVRTLLPARAKGDLGSLCTWADRVKYEYHWSARLHYINTPHLCTYTYSRDCKDEQGVAGRCVAGAINNYTSQLLEYHAPTSQYNLTEALLFLSHFVGDIHQPLHVSFEDDRGGNTIDVQWYNARAILHQVWDGNIIERAKELYFNNAVNGLINLLKNNIDTVWEDDAAIWASCSQNEIACPDVYALEGIKAACDWSYKDAKENAVLEDEYFHSRLPIVYQRLAQGGVRLAVILNRIFT